jgi:arsenite methyltransferase
VDADFPQRSRVGRRLTLRRALLALCLAALLASCSRVERLDFRALGRDMWQRPNDVVAALAIPPGSSVADLGAGKGYFLPYLMQAVGPNGRVLAVEVDDDLVARLRSEFGMIDNVELIRGRLDDPLLPDGAVDLVLLVDTYHHIKHRTTYFQMLSADLAPGGRVVVIEPDAELGGILGLFVKAAHASRAEDVIDEMRDAGYQLRANYDLLPVQLMLSFSRAAP